MHTAPARIVLVGALLVLSVASGLFAHAAAAAEPAVGLGRADDFAVLAGTTVTNTGPTVVNGSLGVSPGTALTGWPPGLVQGGTAHSADATAAGAQDDLLGAWVEAAGRDSNATVSADLAGQTLVGGVYSGTTLALNGTLTLDAQGVPGTVWIFQAASTLITGSNSTVALTNGANACNVFWQVGSSATLGTGTDFIGTVMALTSITANTDASLEGRLLARNGAVTLDSNVITSPDCRPAVTTTAAPDTTTTVADTSTTAVPETTTTVADTTTTAAPDTTTTEAGVTTTTAAATTTTQAAVTTTTEAATTTTEAVGPVTTTTAAGSTTTVGAAAVTTIAPLAVTTTTARPGAATTVEGAAGATTTLPGSGGSTSSLAAGAPTTATTPGGPTVPRTAIPRTGASTGVAAAAGATALLLGAAFLRSARRVQRRLTP